MSRFDYEVSKKLAATDPPFDALIMAAMSKADSRNAARLQIVYPELWDELQARYNAPGGIFPSDSAVSA